MLLKAIFADVSVHLVVRHIRCLGMEPIKYHLGKFKQVKYALIVVGFNMALFQQDNWNVCCSEHYFKIKIIRRLHPKLLSHAYRCLKTAGGRALRRLT